ncbi:hypothetical protein [Tomitella gaofuii]|uniref:hypothetical protein n=1 Tax=Tomitella gaofuii TaxID=2760083 RepID=UPI0015FD45E5|nr:hypothetical protein [Tomitella gaofuii]
MATQLGPVIGRIGGGIDTTPVDDSQYGTTYKTIHTITVPDGETWLIAAVGQGRTNSSLSSRYARVNIDGVYADSDGGDSWAKMGVANTVTGPATALVELRCTGSSIAYFDGTVYVGKAS